MSTLYIVYKGYDNTFTVRCLEDKVPVDITAVTRATLLYKEVVIDSTTDPNSFDFDTYATDGDIVFKLGIISDIEVGRDSYAELVLYDAVNTEGIFWGYLAIKVMELS